jgi:hypothetical protein
LGDTILATAGTLAADCIGTRTVGILDGLLGIVPAYFS